MPSKPRDVVVQLREIEDAGGEGEVRPTTRARLRVTSLDKVYFPGTGHTKGDVMRYYARVSPALLPLLRGRPLVLKRYPEGIDGESFYQQKPPRNVPDAVRVERVPTEEEGKQPRIVGGTLATLLYTVQIGCIAVDPWISRVGSIDAADYAVLDLDPGPEAGFERVVEVARRIKTVLDDWGLRGAAKTSGSRGIHVFLPLRSGTGYDDALAIAERVARRVAGDEPGLATLERSIGERPPGAVYMDYLQNARGKSVAAAYCVRAKPGATVSAPLAWDEVKPGLDLRAFTLDTMPARLERTGDIWAEAMRRRNSVRRLLRETG